MNKTLSIATLALALTACTSNFDDNISNEAQHLATFYGTIAGQNTTRMSGAAWDADDAIGISASSANTDGKTSATNVKYTTAGTDGTFAVADGFSAITFGGTGKVTFTAYYPYSDNNGTVNVSTAAANQTSANQKNIDYLYASATTSIISPNVALKFEHKMSRIELVIEAGTGVDDLSKLSKIELGNIVLDGSFNTATGEATASGDASAIELNSLDIASGQKKYETSLIFIPQDVTDSKLSLVLTYNDLQYSATLKINAAAEGKLKSGNSLPYTVTLNKTALTVSSGSIKDWNSLGSSDVAANEVIDYFVSADDAEMYALAFTDGTYLNVWDNETGTIDDNVWSKFTSRTDKKVCGVVYYNGGIVGEDIRDNVLQYYHPSCTHGYIVALNDLTTERTAWQNPYVFVYDVFQNTEGNAMNPTTSSNPKYEPIFIEYVYPDGGNNTQLAKALGYNNTKVLKAFNDDYCVGDNVDYKVKAVEYLEDFAKSIDAPEGSSGWYIPSPKELELIINDDINFYGVGGVCYETERFKAVKSVLERLEVDGFAAATIDKYLYWSSSECRYTHSPSGSVYLEVWTVHFSYYAEEYIPIGEVSRNAKSFTGDLRAICAF